MQRLDENILRTCLERQEGAFASGVRANNKLDIEKISKTTELRKQVITSLGRIVLEYGPDFVVPVPEGANWIAERISKKYKIPTVQLKIPKNLNMATFANIESKHICRRGMRGVIIEDVFNRFTNTNKVLNQPMIEERAVAAVAVWDRGTFIERTPIGIPHRALITRYIPPMLEEDDPLWEYADD